MSETFEEWFNANHQDVMVASNQRTRAVAESVWNHQQATIKEQAEEIEQLKAENLLAITIISGLVAGNDDLELAKSFLRDIINPTIHDKGKT